VPTFTGVHVPIITPFTHDDRLDLTALYALIDFLIDSGVHGLIPAGSTGEIQCLSRTEYQTLIKETVEYTAGRIPVLACCSANATRDVIANCAFAGKVGADGVMITHPFYSLPDEDELYRHYASIAATLEVPMMIYNNPFTTGVDSQPELLARLSEVEHIDYVKECANDCTRVPRIIELSSGRMTVFCGQDNQALENFSTGAVGWVAGAANVLPRECVELYSLSVMHHRMEEALALYRRLYDYLDLCERSGKFVQVAKAGVEYLGMSAGNPRSPLRDLSEELLERTRRAVDRARAAPVAAQAV
jgi:4-hydroxy-tetrahydrodipicolinate synthase